MFIFTGHQHETKAIIYLKKSTKLKAKGSKIVVVNKKKGIVNKLGKQRCRQPQHRAETLTVNYTKATDMVNTTIII